MVIHTRDTALGDMSRISAHFAIGASRILSQLVRPVLDSECSISRPPHSTATLLNSAQLTMPLPLVLSLYQTGARYANLRVSPPVTGLTLPTVPVD
jgi:hypothetical protein